MVQRYRSFTKKYFSNTKEPKNFRGSPKLENQNTLCCEQNQNSRWWQGNDPSLRNRFQNELRKMSTKSLKMVNVSPKFCNWNTRRRVPLTFENVRSTSSKRRLQEPRLWFFYFVIFLLLLLSAKYKGCPIKAETYATIRR